MIELKQTVHTLSDNIYWILPVVNQKMIVAIFTDPLELIRLNDQANVQETSTLPHLIG